MSRLNSIVYFVFIIFIYNYLTIVQSARILAVFPTPSISHHTVYRPLMHRLAEIGHEVTVITAHPAFPKGQSPENLTEIDVHDISHKLWRKYVNVVDGDENNFEQRSRVMVERKFACIIEQFKSDEVQALVGDRKRKFDLLFVEHFAREALFYSHLYKIPTISINSFGGMYETFEAVGAVTHPLIYPIVPTTKYYNLNIFEKLYQYYVQWKLKKSYLNVEKEETEKLRSVVGLDLPDLGELQKNVQLTFLNTHPIWDNNRPVPPNLVYIYGIHTKPLQELPKGLKSYLDDSIRGVIYMSFGTNTNTSTLPAEKVKLFTEVFSDLPYDVLLKWGKMLPGCPKNVKIGSWFPQSDLLQHKNIKVFITQGGLQSTTEAVDAGVPLIGIPMLGDQWFNTELYLKHEIGLKLDFKTLTKEKLRSAIEGVIGNEKYRENVVRLRDTMLDQPQPPIARAVWWTELVLRRGGEHLRAAAARITWTEYYKIKLICLLLCIIIIVLLAVVYFYKLIYRKFSHSKVKLQ